MTYVKLGIELFGQGDAIGYGTVRKIGKIRGAKDVIHFHSHANMSPYSFRMAKYPA
jgi:hypothetical protein